MSKRRWQQGGFTLVELSIVLVILPLIAAAIGVFFRESLRQVEGMERAHIWQEQARAVFTRMSADVRGSVSGPQITDDVVVLGSHTEDPADDVRYELVEGRIQRVIAEGAPTILASGVDSWTLTRESRVLFVDIAFELDTDSTFVAETFGSAVAWSEAAP